MKTLLADPVALRLEKIISSADLITVVVKTSLPHAACPQCQQLSTKLHSRYTRNLADLPWQGIAVRLLLHLRKFFCTNDACHRRIFCERLPDVVAPYARRTLRLNQALTFIGLALGGRAGARLSIRLAVRAGADTLLRRVRQMAVPKPTTVTVLGVDDWAFKRGHQYGTILIDLERSCVIDLLADREVGTLEKWLKGHPGIQIISRDRARCYAEGATLGAPSAIQIADRFHLLKNLVDALERFLNRQRQFLRQAASNLSPRLLTNQKLRAEGLPELRPLPPPDRRSQAEKAISEQRRAQRVARYEEVKRLHAGGATISAIARQLGVHRQTVRSYVEADECPAKRQPRARPSKVKPFAEYLKQRWLEGCHNVRQLYREIEQQGYQGNREVLRRYLHEWRQLLPEEVRRLPEMAEPPPPAPKTVLWWLLKAEEDRQPEESDYIMELTKLSPGIKTAQELVHEFQQMIRDREGGKLDDWRRAVKESGLKEILSFAEGLQKDEAAVRAALTYRWSNGPVEGHINRLKMLKRQMFGRAKLDLLRARMLYAA